MPVEPASTKPLVSKCDEHDKAMGNAMGKSPYMDAPKDGFDPDGLPLPAAHGSRPPLKAEKP
ncbi:hypothetical protein HDE77_001126 [Rhodanobacter sp. MP7CTX1]|nr:hypothetical protein [Rhodanobacter sp. MP7CTX1]